MSDQASLSRVHNQLCELHLPLLTVESINVEDNVEKRT